MATSQSVIELTEDAGLDEAASLREPRTTRRRRPKKQRAGHRSRGPGRSRLAQLRTYDVSEVDSIESTEESPKVDLGSLILTRCLDRNCAFRWLEETGEIVSAMLVIETIVGATGQCQSESPRPIPRRLSWERTQLSSQRRTLGGPAR